MPNRPISARLADGKTAIRSWAVAIGGMMAGGCAVMAVYAGSGPATGLLMDLAWHQAASKHPALAFEMQDGVADTQILGGVSGEAVSHQSRVLKLADLGKVAIPGSPELSAIAWDRLSAGDCMSLTTASGQKLSFRIVGTRAGEAGRDSASATIDLAITACAPSSDAILKAVIESKAEPKESAVQRTL